MSLFLARDSNDNRMIKNKLRENLRKTMETMEEKATLAGNTFIHVYLEMFNKVNFLIFFSTQTNSI